MSPSTSLHKIFTYPSQPLLRVVFVASRERSALNRSVQALGWLLFLLGTAWATWVVVGAIQSGETDLLLFDIGLGGRPESWNSGTESFYGVALLISAVPATLGGILILLARSFAQPGPASRCKACGRYRFEHRPSDGCAAHGL